MKEFERQMTRPRRGERRVCGMLPLVLFPGAGSELCRGLGSVVVGGLVISTAFTLFLVPALFSLVLDARAGLAARLSTALRAS